MELDFSCVPHARKTSSLLFCETVQRVLTHLNTFGPTCAGDLETPLGKSQSLTAQYLSKVFKAGWVTKTRDGKRVLYQINEDAVQRALAACATFRKD